MKRHSNKPLVISIAAAFAIILSIVLVAAITSEGKSNTLGSSGPSLLVSVWKVT